jgi:hypothetical protein
MANARLARWPMRPGRRCDTLDGNGHGGCTSRHLVSLTRRRPGERERPLASSTLCRQQHFVSPATLRVASCSSCSPGRRRALLDQDLRLRRRTTEKQIGDHREHCLSSLLIPPASAGGRPPRNRSFGGRRISRRFVFPESYSPPSGPHAWLGAGSRGDWRKLPHTSLLRYFVPWAANGGIS